MKNKLYLLLSAIILGALLFAPQAQSQTVITQWNFNAGASDGADPSTGTGTIGTIGGVTHPSFNSGSGSSDPTQPGLGYQTTTYPAQSTNNLTAGIQVNVSTEGYENIVLSFDLRTSNTASRWYQIFYTVNGDDFLPLGTPVRLGGLGDNSVGDAWSNNLSADFSSIPAANENEDFAVRIVSAFSPLAFTEFNSGNEYEANEAYESARNRSTLSQSNYGGGTWRFDMVTISGDLAIAPTTFYYNGSGALTALSSWGANANGTGANPANFTADAQTFIVTNTTPISLTTPWTVSGIGSKVVVGNGTDATILNLQEELDAVVDVKNNGTLVLQSTDLPTFGDLDTGSTVEFAQNDDINIPNVIYQNLILSGTGEKIFPNSVISINENLTIDGTTLSFSGSSSGLNLSGNLTMLNTVSYSGSNRPNITTSGNNIQTINTGSNVFEANNFYSEGKTDGGLMLAADNANILALNNLRLNFADDAVFNDGGNTIIYSDDLRIQGGLSNYVFTGTLRLIGQSSGDHDFDFVDVPLNNLDINLTSGTGRARMNRGTATEIVVNGNFSYFASAGHSSMPMGSVVLSVGGNFTDTSENPRLNTQTSTIIFNGTGDQTFTSAIQNEFNNITINKASGTFTVAEESNMSISNLFRIDNGLVLNNGSVTIASDAFFINTTTNAPTLTFERTLSNHSRWVGLATPANGNYAGVGGFLEGLVTQGFTGSNFPNGVPNVLLYNESGAGTDLDRFVAPSSNGMIPGRGFMFYVFDRTDIEDENTVVDFPFTLSITGETNVFVGGNYSYMVSYTPGNGNGWNLLGNLFGAPFDWNHPDMVKSNLNAFAYIWDPIANQYRATGDDELAETGTLANSRIPSFQAFFVKANDATNELTLTTNTLSTEATAHINNASENFILSLSLEAEGMTANTALRFNETFSNAVDAQDAYYLVPMSDSFAMLYTVTDGEALMINSLNADVTEIIHIPLAAGAFVETMSMSGDATLTWPVIRNLPDGWEIGLRDTETGMMINLLDTDSYTFELGATSLADVSSETIRKDGTPVMNASKMGTRFELVVNPGIASSNPSQPELPMVLSLEQNYPNPFNPTTQIRYELPQAADVRLDVFNIQGQRVATLANQAQTAGTHTLTFDASTLSSGVYVYRLQVGNQVLTRKMTLIK